MNMHLFFNSKSKIRYEHMYLHNDELLYDPLPQPYRFVNKILLRCIEDAIDLAESGGKAESLYSIVSHNLRLTKVGKIPTFTMSDFFLSTDIINHEITLYSLLGDTQYLVCGTSQGSIMVYDPISKSVVYSVSITSLSKFAQQNPVVRLNCFQTDHNNFIISFVTEDAGFLLFLSSTFTLRNSVELDLSQFNFDTLELKNCSEPYLILTDGTGRTVIYNCHTPNELIAADNSLSTSTKSTQSKPFQLETIFEIEKCPISTGPVSSETQLATKTEDVGNKKKPLKKKAPPAPKNKGRPKSPGPQSIDNANASDTTHYQATVYIFENIAVIRFGTFPLLLLYKLASPSQLICEFPIPSPVSACIEAPSGNHLILGFENGSFCFLNVLRKTLHDHEFPKQGAIRSLHMQEDILVTFSESKMINVYKLDSKFKITEKLLTCSDDDILQTNLSFDSLITYNQKSPDIGIARALTTKKIWDGRLIELFPNISIIKAQNGFYCGTIFTPINLELVTFIMNKNWGAFVFNDPIEYRLSTPSRGTSPAHGKRGVVQKGAKNTAANAKKGKPNVRTNKKAVEEVKEGEQEITVVVKRQIIGLADFSSVKEFFDKRHESIEKEKTQRRKMMSNNADSIVEEEEEIGDAPIEKIDDDPIEEGLNDNENDNV